MTKRAEKPLTPPTMVERAEAAKAARALKAALADPSTMGEKSTVHILLSNPRRGEWWETWKNLPEFTRINGGDRYTHSCLPGWEYTKPEIVTEMIPDLEKLAEKGIRPTEVTR